jgi:YD repeat-containing protein
MWLSSAPVVFAQDHPIVDAKGFQLNRDYFSQFPFEYIDTATGALILTFTDLVLPGHLGRDLKFQRTYNSKESAWTFGLAGYILYINEPGMPPEHSPNVEGFAPVLYGSDGARHSTKSLQPVSMTPPALIASTYAWVSTDRFWRYARNSMQQLHFPDGSRCDYEDDQPQWKRLKSCVSPFGNTELSIQWESTKATITQHFPNGQERSVVLNNLTGPTWRRVPQDMTFLGRSWHYEWGEVSRVTPPKGPRWEFRFTSPTLPKTLIVTTPHGGQVGYDLVSEPFPEYNTEPGMDVHSLVVARRWTLDRGAPPNQAAEWIYNYHATELPGGTSVLAPGGGKSIYQNKVPAVNGPVHITVREVRNPAGTVLERETTTYTDQPVVYWDLGAGLVPTLFKKVITERAIERNGQTYATTYEYDDDPKIDYADYHNPTGIVEKGNGPTRTTSRFYKHVAPTIPSSGPLNVGHLEREEVEVNDETFVRIWNRDTNPARVNFTEHHGVKTTFDEWAYGQPGVTTDANGNTTRSWHSWGVVSQIHTPEHRWKREIREDGTTASETQGLGTTNPRTTQYDHDDVFRLLEITPTNAAPGRESTSIKYDEDLLTGYWISTTTTRGLSVITTALDGFGRPVQTTNSAGIAVTKRYDAEGRLIHDGYPVPESAESIGTAIEYDALGRVTKRTNPGQPATFTTFEYGLGTITIRDKKNGQDRAVVQRFQAVGDPDDARLTGLTDAAGQSWTYEYNTLGKLTRVSAPGGIQRTWSYPAPKGWLTSETHPESGTTTYGYAGDNMGLATSRTDAKQQTTTFSYDDNNRLETISIPGETTTIGYEPQGDNRLSVVSSDVNLKYYYDSAGRLKGFDTRVSGIPFEVRYEYDGNDNVSEILYPAPSKRRVRMDYDNENRIINVRDVLSNLDYASGMQYHESGALKQYTTGNNIDFTFTYDPARYWPTGIQAGPLELTYGGYDEVGNVGTITDSRGASWNQSFTYDVLDRLTQATGPFGTIGYAYDPHGNMLTQGADTFSYSPTTLRLTSRNGQAIGHDDNGNLETGLQGVYTYNPHNQMSRATVGTTETSFTYDADQWRVKKVSGDVTTYYVREPSGRLLTEVTIVGSNPPSYRDYIYAGSRLLAVVQWQPLQ